MDNIDNAFPCEFPIKIFGLANDHFEQTVLTIIHKHAPDLAENSIRTRASKDGKYLSITVTIKAKDREQVDAIYQELTASEVVIMAL